MACGTPEVSRDGLVSQPDDKIRQPRVSLGHEQMTRKDQARAQAEATSRADQEVARAKQTLSNQQSPAMAAAAIERAERAVSEAGRLKASSRDVARLKAQVRELKQEEKRQVTEAAALDLQRCEEAAAVGNMALKAVLSRRAAARISASQWVPAGSRPPDVGVIFNAAGEAHTVSFKVGVTGGSREGHTLIADGDLSDDAEAFNQKHGHNHYGPDSADPESTFAEDRGAYTGPDH